MKKLIYISLCVAGLSLAPTVLHAQANESAISYNKASVSGFTTSIQGEKGVVADAMDAYFKKTFDTKSSSSKGFTVYKGVSWPEVSTEKLDVYYKVDNKKNNNTVNMMVSKGYDNFVSSQSDAVTAQGVINFMNTIKDRTVGVVNANAVKEAEDKLGDAQKEYDKAVNKGKDLKSDKEKIEKEIASQDKTISEKEAALNKAKDELERAKSKL